MTNREWILSEILKADDSQLADAFCGMSDFCFECPLKLKAGRKCPMFRSDTREWMQKEHEVVE